MRSSAFIDGQNLYMGTMSGDPSWKLDLGKFRIYLGEKYNIHTAYYFLGYKLEYNHRLYQQIESAGFTLCFRQHSQSALGRKKGNIDSDLIFTVMKKLYRREDVQKIVLVSGDGDYKLLVDFLIEEERFEKILFPNKKYASSLYRSLSPRYFDYLENPDIRRKIGYKKKGSP